ncbi:hypothetical protein B7R54_13875 [Subtercola boreus]|uniref:Uncharacterized protein n=1 Tax=Subtercola boreus TaxID=120213 RepID=A0A3E0VJN8_9MICO|nr:hypothetical protein [Subtercola boreus]RFA10174.1 hypothetical protein B7R54_13875 [Subtercola boreus]TQL52660.1 hypothetical protein FB464_0143 [Subtercola boreus]
MVSSAAATESYENLTVLMRDEEGVAVTADGLTVHGTLFAFLHGDDLVVELPAARGADLQQRGIAAVHAATGLRAGDWVRVEDQQLWPELAGEAHTFVGEPAVGGDS